MKIFRILIFVCVSLSANAQAQNINFGILDTRYPEKLGNVFLRSPEQQIFLMQQQMQVIQQIEAARVARAQADMLEAQARREEEDRRRTSNTTSPQNVIVDPVLIAFNSAASARRHLYPDFESVAYAPDVQITVDMIKLMTGSSYAADIAYYLGKNKGEAAEISRMHILQASKAITDIENKMRRP